MSCAALSPADTRPGEADPTDDHLVDPAPADPHPGEATPPHHEAEPHSHRQPARSRTTPPHHEAESDGFASLRLPRELLDAVTALGFTQPTSIQASAIPPLLDGRDVTGVAQTGTGKTAAFGLPLLAAVDPAVAGVQALVLAPTRELALQVARAIAEFASRIPGLEVAAVYGGAPMGPQLAALRRGAQVVVGTPGRIIDHLERGSLTLDAVRFVVLDEADEMLQMGFAEDVDRILSDAPANRQTALFSATMPSAIRGVAARHLRRPVDVSVASSATPVDAIRQRFAVLPFRQKADALVRILAVSDIGGGSRPHDGVDAPAPGSRSGRSGTVSDQVQQDTLRADAAVVFVRTRSACEELGAQLQDRGVSAAVISGDVAQNERERTIRRLRERQIDVLVATDVAARGLDVGRIGLVVNFDAPSDPETYIHRVGRTGRAGRAGEALLFVTPREMSRLRAIERATGQRLEQIVPPTLEEMTAHRAAAALRAAVERHAAGRLDAFRAALESAAAESGLPVTELAAAMLAAAVGDDGTAPVPAPEPELATRRSRDDNERRSRDSNDQRSRDSNDQYDRRARSERSVRNDRPARHDRPDLRAAGEFASAARAGRSSRRDTLSRNDADAARYVVQVGRRHGVRPAGIVGAITGEGGLSGADVGRIDIFDHYSVVEIVRPMGSAALARIRRATVSGQQLRIRPDRPNGRGSTPDSPRGLRTAGQRRGGKSASWAPGTGGRSPAGRLPFGKRDSALPGTPRVS